MISTARKYPNLTAAIDLDGVAADFIDGFQRTFFHLDFDKPLLDAERPWGFNGDTFAGYLRSVPPGFWVGLDPMPGFGKVVRRWLEDGVNVIFVTSRDVAGSVVDETHDWLTGQLGPIWDSRYNDSYDRCSLVFTQDKASVQADVWFEDLPEHLTALTEANRKVCAFNHPYNEKVVADYQIDNVGGWRDADIWVKGQTIHTPHNYMGSGFHIRQSSLKQYRNCPRKFVSQFFSGELGSPGQPAMVGTFTHSVLEQLLMLKPEMRTLGAARSIAGNEPIPYQVENVREFKGLVWKCVLRFFNLLNPGDLRIGYLERTFRTEIAGVPTTGTIDIQYSDGSIADIKTGSASRFAHKDNEHQLRLYALAVKELDGQLPPKAEVIYLNEKNAHISEVDLSEKHLEQVRHNLGWDYKKMLDDLRTGEGPPTPNVLCGWCELATKCSEGEQHIRELYAKGKMKETAPQLQRLEITQ